MSTDARQFENEPTYWFVILEKAMERRDIDTAARAKRELKRLGVKVEYKPRREATQ